MTSTKRIEVRIRGWGKGQKRKKERSGKQKTKESKTEGTGSWQTNLILHERRDGMHCRTSRSYLPLTLIPFLFSEIVTLLLLQASRFFFPFSLSYMEYAPLSFQFYTTSTYNNLFESL